jgi:outer membrane protein assembly factor BamB
MTAIHVLVRPLPERATGSDVAALNGLFDVVIDGVNVTARVGEGQAITFLAELGTTVAEMLAGRRTRSVVQLYSSEDAWELGLETDGSRALISVFRSGPEPEVAVLERPVEWVALRQGLLDALQTARNVKTPRAVSNAIELSQHLLQSVAPKALPQRPTCDISVTPRLIRNFAFRADAKIRATNAAASQATSHVERADLHALLFSSTFGVSTKGRVSNVPRVPLFLVADRLVELARETLAAKQQAKPLFRRYQVGNVRIGVRLAPVDSPLAFSLGSSDAAPGTGLTFPELDPVVFAQSVVLFVRSLRDAVIAADPSQAHNLKLTSLVSEANQLAEQAQPVESEQSVTNPRPEEYRRFMGYKAPSEARGRWENGLPMRFLARWSAAVPNIDLKSVLVSGEHFLIGSSRETACLDKTTGDVLWRQSMARAGTIAIPNGFVRLYADGRLAVHDMVSGRTRFSVKLVPRAFGGAAGAVVLVPGLPKLIVVSEGDRRVTAVDLVSGEVRWRYTARRPAPLRVRRAGKLILVAGGDSVLVALDVATGETVWQATDKLPFTGDIAVEGEEAIALSAGAQGRGHLHCFDVCSGESRYRAIVEERALQGQSPLVSNDVVVIATRDARGAGARAFDRRTGEPIWNLETGQLPRQAGWVSVDDGIVVNGSDGTITGIETNTGAYRFRHVLARPLDPDIPRQLQPVLRSGALFVPQQQVMVMRPKDGQMLGTVPSDLLPDVVRVDEQSTVYLTEESGHIACFTVAPMLMRVK